MDRHLLKTLVLCLGIPALAACGDDTGTTSMPDAMPDMPDAMPDEPDAAPPVTGTDIIDQFMEDSIAGNRFVGGVAMFYQEGGESYTKTFGVKDIVSGDPMPEDGLFRIVSLGKTIVSAAAMDMLEEGLFTLDDPISMHLPEWANQQKIVSPDPATPDDPASFAIVDVDSEITIRHLLTHTSGLIFKFYGVEPISGLLQEAGIVDGLNNELTDGTLQTYSEALAAQPLLHEPGERWTYGPNLEIMARIMEVVEPGKSFDQILKERVLDPLGMNDCGFYYDGADVDRFIPLHTINPETGEWIIFPDTTLSFGQPDQPTYWDINPTYPYNQDAPRSFYSPSEGLVCSPADLLKYARMILNKGELDGTRVLDEATVDMMTTNQIGDLDCQDNPDYDFGFGFGINVGPNRFNGRTDGPSGELDWGGYFNTFYTVDYTNNLITVVMTQTFLGPDFSLQLDYKDAVYRALELVSDQ